jgi:cytosine/adenosine deaminase-related metal-dependent hydrolase
MSQSREKRMILRARTLVTMKGVPIDNGAAVIDGERIVDVGSFDQITAHHSGELVDLGEQALLPGLINAHCHLDYTSLRGKILPRETFTDWIRAIVSEKEKLSPQDYVASIGEGFAEAKKFGTTSIANLTAFPELIPKLTPPIRTWWFPELIDIRTSSDGPQNLADLFGQVSHSLALTNFGLAPHAPFTASAKLYRECEQIARRENVVLTTHLAESRDEMEMFSESRGPLFDFLAELGRAHSDLHAATPVQHVAAFCRLDDRWLLVHLNELAGGDINALRQANTLPHVVHCPRSHACFGHSHFQFQKLREVGFNVCLGTDSLASNDDLNLFAEMRAFGRNEPSISPREILEMVTVNAASALNQSRQLGRVANGFVADLIAVPCTGSTSVFEEILAFDETIAWMMIAGKCVNVVA